MVLTKGTTMSEIRYDFTGMTKSELEQLLKQAKDDLVFDAMSDDFYHSNGRHEKQRNFIKAIVQALATMK